MSAIVPLLSEFPPPLSHWVQNEAEAYRTRVAYAVRYIDGVSAARLLRRVVES